MANALEELLELGVIGVVRAGLVSTLGEPVGVGFITVNHSEYKHLFTSRLNEVISESFLLLLKQEREIECLTAPINILANRQIPHSQSILDEYFAMLLNHIDLEFIRSLFIKNWS